MFLCVEIEKLCVKKKILLLIVGIVWMIAAILLFIFYRNFPDFLVKKTFQKQLTFDKKYVCFKITGSARYEWGSRYGKRKERETDT